MADNNNSKPILSHNERKLFSDYMGSGHLGTNGYYETDLENKNVLEPTFENKLHQSKDETKNYYNILKNELLSYRATSEIGPDYEVFRVYEVCVSRLSLYCGRVRLRLEFDKKRTIKNLKKAVAKLEDILVSNGYIEMYVDTTEKCDRAIDLIGVLMRDIEVVKNPDYEIVDFIKDYPIIEDGIFSFVEDEEQDVPELVVVGNKERKSRVWMLLIVILALAILITIGACELYQTKKEIRYPTFEIVDTNNDVVLSEHIYETEVNIFNNPYMGGAKVIHPGRESTYYFYVSNTNDYTFTCSLYFNEKNLEDINMVYRLRIANASAENEPWHDISEINRTNVTVGANSKLLCALDWKWADADNDTEIGERGLATYTLTITFSEFAKVEEENK